MGIKPSTIASIFFHKSLRGSPLRTQPFLRPAVLNVWQLGPPPTTSTRSGAAARVACPRLLTHVLATRATKRNVNVAISAELHYSRPEVRSRRRRMLIAVR